LPDLILIDGGKGQYSSAKEVLDELGLHDLPMIAIAKGKLRNSGDETFFFNGKSFKFEKNDQLYSLCKDLETKRIDLQSPP
jgi:excinuclease ABC subunit C